MAHEKVIPGAPQCMNFSKNQGFWLPTYIGGLQGPEYSYHIYHVIDIMYAK